jgi:MFS family permease
MTVRAYPAALRSNFRNLYLDILWFGVMSGSVLAFITIYATRLGASVFQISLLTAGPAAINLLISLPAGEWLKHRALIPTTFWSAFWHRLGYLILIPLPLLFPGQVQVWLIVFLTLLISMPGTILAIGFNTVFAEVVPPEWRAEVVGKRNAIVAISLTVTTLISGQLLDWLIFPINYVVVFAIGALGAGLSTYYLGKLRGQVKPTMRPEVFEDTGLKERPSGENRLRGGLHLFSRARLSQLLNLDLLRSSFGLVMLAYLMFYTFQYLGIPIFPLVQVRVLNLSDGVISLGSGLFYGVMLLISLRIVEISTRLGHKRTLATGATILAAYPFLLGLAQGPALFWVASIIGGGAWGITNAGLTNRLMEKVPADQRPGGMALHNLVLNLGILVGSLTAPLLGETFGLQQALFVVALLRLLAGGIFWLWG